MVGQPTRGVDIAATDFIHRRLLALKEAGTGILSSRPISTRSAHSPTASWSWRADGSPAISA
ncbi:MAG: hypothetical protein JO358_22595 [Alphaproteobacteria bacterium]|nr:hypothetical protein [Alphaproteobacteria bacterium]